MGKASVTAKMYAVFDNIIALAANHQGTLDFGNAATHTVGIFMFKCVIHFTVSISLSHSLQTQGPL